MSVEWGNPWMLLFLIPAAASMIFYVMKKRKDRYTVRVLALTRSLVFLLLILALAMPTVLLPAKGQNTIFIKDVSASISDQEALMDQWINEAVEGKREQDQFAIISSAENAIVDQVPTAGERVTPGIFPYEQSQTNLEKSLQTALSVKKEGLSSNVVILTDGNETAGNVEKTAALFQQQGIPVNIAPFTPEQGGDIALSDLGAPSLIYEGEEIPVTVTIESDREKSVSLRFLLNDQPLGTETVEVTEGVSQWTFRFPATSTGFSVIDVELIAEQDRIPENNRLQVVTDIQGEPRVLVVSNEESSLSPMLTASGLNVSTVTAKQYPQELQTIVGYDSIVFENVSATDFTEAQMELTESAVKEFGTGFIMTGGENSYGLGGYFETPIERLLPVDMDIKGENELPSLGLVIVVDRSGSMSGGKLELAKEAAARSVSLLREKDSFGFIAFDEKPWEIVEFGPLSNKDETVETIQTLSLGGGTSIYPALESAYETLSDKDLQRKHIILLTDGQSQDGDYEELIAGGLDENITLSTVAIGGDADGVLLESLSESGNGRFYDVVDPSSVPSILSRETAMTTRTYIEDEPFYPVPYDHPFYRPFFENGVSEMNAYIATSPKSTATVVLESGKEDPVMSEWLYGVGRTMAFTSDTSGEWSGDFARSDEWPSFWTQVVTRSFPTFIAQPLDVQWKSGEVGETLVVTQSDSSSAGMMVEAIDSKGKSVIEQQRVIGPGKIELDVNAAPGLIFVNAEKLTADGVTYSQAGVPVPYSKEYRLTGTNDDLITSITEATSGMIMADPSEAFAQRVAAPSRQSITEWLVVAAFLLYVLEIAFRRFGVPKLAISRKVKADEPVMDKAVVPEKPQPAETNEPAREPSVERKKKPKKEPPKELAVDRLLKAKNRRG